MNFTTLSLIAMLLVLKFTTANKWWLSFAILLSFAAQCGYKLQMFGLIVTLVIWKVFKDLCQASRRN
jgi:hypothetical protein